jgi:ferredoxin, 2Fe-2S
MPLIHLIDADGATHDLEAAAGQSLMQAAVAAGLGNIVGECGGAAMCATCHVYVDDAWLARLPAMQENEDGMLDAASSPRQPNSRLSCQLRIEDDWQGFAVHLPATQV